MGYPKQAKKMYLSDEAIIEGLRLRSDFIIKHLYKNYYPIVRFMLKQNTSKDPQKAEDIFLDALFMIARKIRNDELLLTGTFKSYFCQVCTKLA